MGTCSRNVYSIWRAMKFHGIGRCPAQKAKEDFNKRPKMRWTFLVLASSDCGNCRRANARLQERRSDPGLGGSSLQCDPGTA